MRREQLEHVLRAASEIVGERDVLVIGSQAVLASIPDARLPIEATTSIEADLAFLDDPEDEKADQVDGAIGELSSFHETFGYYAQGVSVSTAVLPAGWRSAHHARIIEYAAGSRPLSRATRLRRLEARCQPLEGPGLRWRTPSREPGRRRRPHRTDRSALRVGRRQGSIARLGHAASLMALNTAPALLRRRTTFSPFHRVRAQGRECASLDAGSGERRRTIQLQRGDHGFAIVTHLPQVRHTLQRQRGRRVLLRPAPL